MNKKTDNLLELLVDKRRFSLRLLLEGLTVGLGAGISISVFRYLLAGSEILRPVIYHNLREALADGQWQWLALYILSFIIIAYLLKLIVAREPMCTGSGIPQIKGILQGDMSMRWFSVLWSKIIGGVLAIGAGMSLGREGPSVQIGACAVSRSLLRDSEIQGQVWLLPLMPLWQELSSAWRKCRKPYLLPFF